MIHRTGRTAIHSSNRTSCSMNIHRTDSVFDEYSSSAPRPPLGSFPKLGNSRVPMSLRACCKRRRHTIPRGFSCLSRIFSLFSFSTFFSSRQSSGTSDSVDDDTEDQEGYREPLHVLRMSRGEGGNMFRLISPAGDDGGLRTPFPFEFESFGL